MKSAISSLVAKFANFNLALYSGVVIYLPILGIIFSTIVRAVVAAKLFIPGISFLTSLTH